MTRAMMMRLHQGLWLLAAVWLGGAGCAASTSGTCRDDSECAAGSACVAGSCRPLSGGEDFSQAVVDFSTEESRDLRGMGPVDLGPIAGDIAPQCSINNDGVLQRQEAPFVVGLGGIYVVNGGGGTVPVVVRAQNGVWDYSAPVQGDVKVFDQLLTAGGAWWTPDFPGATHAQKIDASSGLLGVYKATADSLLLLGIVSEQGGIQQTSLKYTTPITVLKFPMQMGTTWVSESDVSGLASGVFFAAHEKYSFAVDARAATKVPAGSFDTLRLRINYTQNYGLLVTTRIQYLHLAECFGLVARLRSKDGEQAAEFAQAAEFRRMSTP